MIPKHLKKEYDRRFYDKMRQLIKILRRKGRKDLISNLDINFEIFTENQIFS